MRPRGHLIISTAVSAGVYAASRSWTLTSLSWIAGVLIDVDHVLDYLVTQKRLDPYPMMFKHFDRQRSKKCYLWLHGFEWIPVIGLLSWTLGQPLAGSAILMGYSQHLLLDQWANGLHPLFYFLTFRAANGFEAEKLGVLEKPD